MQSAFLSLSLLSLRLTFNPQLEDRLGDDDASLRLSFVFSLCLRFVGPSKIRDVPRSETTHRAMNSETSSLP